LKNREFRTYETLVISGEIYLRVEKIEVVILQISSNHGGHRLSPIMSYFQGWIGDAYALNA
jgi:hypothetical protein